MLGLAAPTPYDLRFRLLGIPVRVHPLFWLIMAVLSGGENHLPEVLIFIGCAFLSILVHEYGHGLVSRFYGHPPAEIVLFWMGGYCACDLGRQRPWHRLAVLVAGPGPGSCSWACSSSSAKSSSESALPTTWNWSRRWSVLARAII